MNRTADERLRRILGFSLYLLAALWGLLPVLYSQYLVLYLPFAAIISFTMTYWCIVDGRIVGHPILNSFYWLIFFFWPIAVPIQLFRSRGLRGLGFALLHFAGIYGVCFIVFHVAGYSAYGSAWFSFPP
jgi:hypothetical protein